MFKFGIPYTVILLCILMIEYTLQNHFRFGYDQQWFAPRTDNRPDAWSVAYGTCHEEPGNLRAENARAARLIAETHRDPVLLFSGGADSEVALRAFVDAGLPIRCAIIRFANGLNAHDIVWAAQACDALGIHYRHLDLDLEDFVRSGECEAYADIAKAAAPEVTISMWAADRIDGVPVIGQGECYLVKDVPSTYVPGQTPYGDEPWMLWEREWVASWYRFFIARGTPAVPGFHQFTPGQMLAFLRDDEVRALYNNQRNGKLSTKSSKMAIYRRYYDLADREKYTGFEYAAPIISQVRNLLAYRHAAYTATAKTPIAQLLQTMAPK